MATSKNSPTAGEVEDLGTVVDMTSGTDNTADAQPEPPKMADLKGVRYVGTADKKTLTVNDIVGVGVENPKGDLVFSQENHFFIPGTEFNAATRDWLASQSDFVVE